MLQPACCLSCVPSTSSCHQGFDKYGVGAFDAVPTPHLQKALGLKAGELAGCWLLLAAGCCWRLSVARCAQAG